MPKILIIEENTRLSEALASFLLKKGLESSIAPDGITGVRSFVSDTYDLLLINAELPLLNGIEVSRKIRSSNRGRQIPIVMMSGAIQDAQESGKLKQEIDLQGFLSKPFTSVQLYALIAGCLKLPATDRPAPSAPAVQTAAPHPEEKPSPPVDAPAISTPPVAQDEPPKAALQAVQPSAPPQPAVDREQRPLSGELDSVPFEQVLFYLLRKRGTGILTMTREGLTRTLFFVDGALADVEISPEDEDFGSYLYAKSIIRDEELKEYKERRQLTGSDPRDIFIKMGCLTTQQFQEENAGFMQERLVESFSWRTGSVLFEWGPSVIRTIPSATAITPLLFYRGFRAHVLPERVNAFSQEKGALYPVRTEGFYEYQNHLASETGTDLLDLIDGTRTCFDIMQDGNQDEASIVLYTLDYLRCLKYSPTPQKSTLVPPFPLRQRVQKEPVREQDILEDLGGDLSALVESVASQSSQAAPAQSAGEKGLASLEEDLKRTWEDIKDKNYYEMFGMKQGSFSFEKLKKTYFELMKVYGPEKFFASSSEVMKLAEELLSKISNAYETLSNVVSKENYDELLASQEQAPTATDDRAFYENIQFQSGKVFLEQGQYDSAEKAFTNCLNIDPEKAEYLVYLALAVYHNPLNKNNPGAIKRAKDSVNKSIQKGKLSVAYALKGTMYLDECSLNFAEAEFNKALKLNPDNKTALKGVETVRARREEEKKGLFQRMFGK